VEKPATNEKSGPTIVVLDKYLGESRNSVLSPPENHMFEPDFVGTFPEVRPETVRQEVHVRPNINIATRGTNQSYSQIGILTRPGINAETLILPLMGRRLDSGRNKMQYYTISNTGNMNTKLPVSKDGRSCTGEYGCDEIFNGDTVYVEGYADTFKATIYENSRERLTKIQNLSLNESNKIKNAEVEKEKAIKKYVKDTGNYSDMFCVDDSGVNKKDCIIEEEDEDEE